MVAKKEVGDTNAALRKLIHEHSLTYRDIAELTGKSTHAVNAWLRTGGDGYRRMPRNDLRILQIELEGKRCQA